MYLPYSQTVFKLVHNYRANTRFSNDEFGKIVVLFGSIW